nr:integrating conjugative element protein [Spartinivicinus marinus]
MAIAKSNADKTITINYPFITASLTPGRVTPKKANFFWLQTPFFIVGTDNVSAQWMQANYDVLKKNHAVGLIVNANSEASVQRLKAVGQGLNLFVASGDSLARELGIRHYPAVVSKYGVEQ